MQLMISLQLNFINYFKQPAVWLGLLFTLIGLAVLAAALYQSQFVRYLADDFCTAAVVQAQGWWQAQQFWYQQWSGRFAFTAVVSALELTGITIVPWLPLLSAVAWLIGLSWLLRNIAHLLGYSFATIPAFAVSLLVITMYILTNPQPGQAFFWFTGNLTYTLPLVLVTYMGLLASHVVAASVQLKFNYRRLYRQPSIIAAVVCIALLAFFAAGLNETHALAQLSILLGLILLLGIMGLSQSRRAACFLPMTVLTILASLAGFWLMYQAPGNDTRAQNYPPNPTIELALADSVNAINDYLIIDWPYAWFVYLAVVVAVLVVALPTTRSVAGQTTTRLLNALSASLWTIVIAYILIVIHYAPSYYIQYYPTQPRTYAASAFILAIAAIVIGYIWGKFLSSYQPRPSWRYAYLSAIIVISLGLSWRIIHTQIQPLWQANADHQAQWQAYADSWDSRHQQLLSQANSTHTITVNRLGYTMGLEDINHQSDHWINQCLADFYHLHQVVGQ